MGTWCDVTTVGYVTLRDDVDISSHRKEVDFKDDEVQRHGQSDAGEQPSIAPRRHHQK